MIYRRAGAARHDVIVLRRSSATPGQLGTAVLHLLILRDRLGDTARVDGVLRLPTATRAPQAWRQTEEVRAGRTLARVRQTNRKHLTGIELLSATEIYFPSRAMRGAARAARDGCR
jgi:hypothetical protein